MFEIIVVSVSLFFVLDDTFLGFLRFPKQRSSTNFYLAIYLMRQTRYLESVVVESMVVVMF